MIEPKVITTINKEGRSMNAKGRNGYFKVAVVEVHKNIGGGLEGEVKETHIDIYSKRSPRRNCAPCRIEGTDEEIRNLIGSLYDAIIKNRAEEGSPCFIRVMEKGRAQ